MLILAGREFVAGESIAARVDVPDGTDDKLREVRIELGYKNTYYYRRSRSSSDGGGWEDALATETILVATKQVPFDEAALAAGRGTFDLTLALPGDAPASVPKWVEWRATAIIDRRRARDRRHAVPITVLASPAAHAAWAQAPQVCDPKCEMFFEMPSRVARLGETLSGVLHVNPTQRFEARRVRVALEHRIHHEDRIETKLGEENVTVADRTEFVPGFPQRFAFQIAVPPDGAPSMHAKHNEVHWHLKGVCDRRLRGDYEVAAELAVYNAAPEPARLA